MPHTVYPVELNINVRRYSYSLEWVRGEAAQNELLVGKCLLQFVIPHAGPVSVISEISVSRRRRRLYVENHSTLSKLPLLRKSNYVYHRKCVSVRLGNTMTSCRSWAFLVYLSASPFSPDNSLFWRHHPQRHFVGSYLFCSLWPYVQQNRKSFIAKITKNRKALYVQYLRHSLIIIFFFEFVKTSLSQTLRRLWNSRSAEISRGGTL